MLTPTKIRNFPTEVTHFVGKFEGEMGTNVH